MNNPLEKLRFEEVFETDADLFTFSLYLYLYLSDKIGRRCVYLASSLASLSSRSPLQTHESDVERNVKLPDAAN